MEKIVTVFTAPESVRDDCRHFVPRIGAALADRVAGLTVHIAGGPARTDFLDSAGPEGKPGPDLYDSRIYCGLTFWVERIETADALYAALDFMPGDRAFYSVVETVSREYAQFDWPVGTESPGATLLALFRRKPGLTTDEFASHWQAHSVLSLRSHPLTRYYRNFVLRRVAGTGEDWDGIVEERVGSLEDLAPERFYLEGSQTRAISMADNAKFIDLQGGMRCNLLREFVLKQPPWLEGMG